MSSTLFPVKNESGNEEEIKKLEGEIEALRCSTQQAIQQSFQDADRIRDEIQRELERKNSLAEQIQKIKESSLGETEAGTIEEIMNLIASNSSDRNSSQDSQIKAIFGPFSQDNYSVDFDSVPSNSQASPEGRTRKSFKQILDIGGSLAGSIFHPLIDKPTKSSFNQTMRNQGTMLSSTWHGRIPKSRDRFEPFNQYKQTETVKKSISSGNLNMIGGTTLGPVKEERQGLESELHKEIIFFEQLSKVAIEELDRVLGEKNEKVEDLEHKVRSQQNQIKNVQEAIERTKTCLADSSLHVDFPINEEKFEMVLSKDDKIPRVFSKSGLTKVNQGTKKRVHQTS